jgi:predicted anti-sigma-YlaC factor YlaD
MIKKTNAVFFFLVTLPLLVNSCATSPSFAGKMLPKLIESNEKKLAKDSTNRDLILETGRYYISYANAFVDTPAGMLPPEERAKKESEKKRAKELYLRGVEILETASGVEDDVDFLYWKSAGTLAAYSIDPFDYGSGLGAKVPQCIEMLNHAWELEPDWEEGSLSELFFLIYASFPPQMGGDKEKAKTYFFDALEKSNRKKAGPYITWAEAISIPVQDYGEFRAMLQDALNVKPGGGQSNILANKVHRQKAKWLLDHAQYFFIEFE